VVSFLDHLRNGKPIRAGETGDGRAGINETIGFP